MARNLGPNRFAFNPAHMAWAKRKGMKRPTPFKVFSKGERAWFSRKTKSGRVKHIPMHGGSGKSAPSKQLLQQIASSGTRNSLQHLIKRGGFSFVGKHFPASEADALVHAGYAKKIRGGSAVVLTEKGKQFR